MIQLTRFSGSRFVLNSDLIERVDATPDTVVTLSDGTKYVVAETLDDVVQAVLEFRARIRVHAGLLQRPTLPDMTPTPHLASVTPLADGQPTAAHPTDGQDL